MKKMLKILNGDRFFQMMVTIILTIFLLVELYPLLYVVSASLSDPVEVQAGNIVLFPKGFTLEGYKFVIANRDIVTGYINTIFYTVVGTVLNLAVTLPCAYALSRKELTGKKIILIYFMVTMYIGGGMIPSYLNVKSFGLVNTRLYMLIGGVISVYNMIVCKTFFQSSIPYELYEAARMDGCNDFKFFSKITMPLSKALIAVMTLYYGIGHWNSYFSAMIYLEDREKFPLQLFLREILIKSEYMASLTEDAANYSEAELAVIMQAAENATLIKYCVIVVAALPLMLIYPKLQKFFEKGVMIGSVKG